MVPTLCLLWLMESAVRNERLAVRQKLEEAYRDSLVKVQQELHRYWEDRLQLIHTKTVDLSLPASERFAFLVQEDVCDSALIFDSMGNPSYPTLEQSSDLRIRKLAEVWQEAEALEYRFSDYQKAGEQYSKLVQASTNPTQAGQALIAQARCLVKSGDTASALSILAETLNENLDRGVIDPRYQTFLLNAQFYRLQLMEEVSHPDYESAKKALISSLLDYRNPAVLSPQRRFLMKELLNYSPHPELNTMLRAEEIAARYMESAQSLLPPSNRGQLLHSELPQLLQLGLPDSNGVLLYKRKQLLLELNRILATHFILSGEKIELWPDSLNPQEAFLSIPAGAYMKKWRIALFLEGPDPFAEAAEKQIAIYFWISFLVILTLAILAWLIIRTMLRQMKLTRLKNDLIATVSHELKTPLSSMRVLVDTLMEGRCPDPDQQKEYLELISRENMRLSRLIDNFLSFSRMERGKMVFEKDLLKPEEIANDAVEAVQERFRSAGCLFEVEIASPLPEIIGDRDALVTVLLNLLDNAFKYTKTNKCIFLKVSLIHSWVCFQVQDNGIGLTKREAKKIFERFYQVDRTLSRSAEGCGLGLSIAQFIIKGHGGTLTVESKSGEGSCFTIALPAIDKERKI